jgi:hypothetical protein
MQREVWWAGSTKKHTVSFCRLNHEDGETIFFRNNGIQPPHCTVSQAKRPQYKTSGPWITQTYKTPDKNLKNMETVISSHSIN